MSILAQLVIDVAQAESKLHLRKTEYEDKRVVLNAAFEEMMQCSTNFIAAQTALIREHIRRMDESARASGRTLDDLIAAGDISPEHATAIKRFREEKSA